MTTLIRWEPFAEFRSIRRTMDNLFGELAGMPRPGIWAGEWSFPLDVSETDDALVLKAALPGLRPDDLDISVHEDVLSIKGELKQEQKVERENYYRRELRHGIYSRSVPLPVHVEHEKAEASFENGILTVRLPKAEKARPKTIKVRPKETVEAED
jgi:HSP20 family protein